MSSDASKEWSGTFKELSEKRNKIKRQLQHHITEHQRLDQTDSRDEERRKRTEQVIKTLNKAHEKIEGFLKSNSQGKRLKEVKSNITDNESAKMTTSKGTIQGYNGVASVDKKHQVIIDAQAFGAGQEHHTLQPVLEAIKARYKRLQISDDIYQDDIIVTADTGFANEANMQYLHANKINGYIPDNKFRSRDPKFAKQKDNHGKRSPITGKKKETSSVIPASEFTFDPVNKICRCPAGQDMWLRSECIDEHGHTKIFFEGRLSKCRACKMKQDCMRNPNSANSRKGHGRQVSFITQKSQRAPNYTDWMKHRVDSNEGKLIYSHRMSVVEPVFGNIGTNKRLNRFSLRSKKKVQCQWQLYCIVHNIEKLKNYGELAA